MARYNLNNKLINSNDICLSQVARCNIIYYLKENNFNINKLFEHKVYNYKTNVYKYFKGSRTITLKFIESISKILRINPQDILDINLYKKNILNNYNFNYKHINRIKLKKNIDRAHYINQQRNLPNKPTLKQLSIELGISKERVRQIEKITLNNNG